MTRTKSSRALLSVVLAVLMAAAFMPSLTYSSFAATAKKATKVTKASHADKAKFTRTVGTAWTLKYKLSPSKLTSSAKKVTWKSSNSKVAKITTIKSGKAVVSFKSTGSATVTVATKANPKAKTSWKFKVVNKKAVKKVAATGVTVAADNSKDYTKELTAGTVLTASVAPADATGVTYQWYADDQPISGATAQKFTVTTDQIGKTISVKATDDSKNTVESAKSAKVSDVTLTGTKLVKVNSDNTTTDVTAGNPGYPVGTKLALDNSSLTGAKQITDVAAVKWIRTIKSPNGTAQDTTVAENTNTYTVTKADLAAVQNGATVTIKAEVTPNTGVKTYGTTNGKFTTVAAQINGSFDVAIQANGKDVANVKAGTKLTAVVTPSDVKVTYQWYKDGKQIAGATSAEYTPTEDGTYRVHVAVASDETTFDKTTHKDASVKVGGLTIEKVVLKNADEKATAVTPKSTLKADAQWTHGEGTAFLNSAKYTWYRNGVKLDDSYTVNGKSYTFNGTGSTYSNLILSDVAKATGKDITTADSFYCVVQGTGDFLSDPVTSNTVKVGSLGTITKQNEDAKLYGKTVYATGLDLSKYNAQLVTFKSVKTADGKDVYTGETVVDSTVNNHATKLDSKDTTYVAADQLKDLTDAEASNLYLKLTGTNDYDGTVYVKVTGISKTAYFVANKTATGKATVAPALPEAVQKEANISYQWQWRANANGTWANCTQKSSTSKDFDAEGTTGSYQLQCVVTIDGVQYTTAEPVQM
ncbi:MAG: hypothetical protein LKE86_08475 [Eubacterium sp.]|jgi:hypothetical protein|nr:hypothetical protein [Eubacterium sp.]MCH4047442.1 hypothetical protein [Eubacterium sp.]MCH4080523.1 hypothetical protein [Eubacterium sp.]